MPAAWIAWQHSSACVSVAVKSQFARRAIMLKRVSRMLVALGTVAVLLPLSTLAAFGMPAQQADRPAPIEVPAVIQVPEGNTLVRIGHAVGTQNYVCLPSDSGVKFVLF